MQNWDAFVAYVVGMKDGIIITCTSITSAYEYEKYE